jgi:hypothetical protein
MVNLLLQRRLEERKAMWLSFLSKVEKGKRLVLLVQLLSQSRRKIPRVNQCLITLGAFAGVCTPLVSISIVIS